jgi:hypothetical protein
MKAYKVWYETKNFIHKDTTDELNVKWTTEIKEAKDAPYDFFFKTLGFNNSKHSDMLLLM